MVNEATRMCLIALSNEPRFRSDWGELRVWDTSGTFMSLDDHFVVARHDPFQLERPSHYWLTSPSDGPLTQDALTKSLLTAVHFFAWADSFDTAVLE